MTHNSIEKFVHEVQSAWGPLGTETVVACRQALEQLVQTPATEPWLAALQRNPPDDALLYRDAANGFLLLTHAEQAGRYRVPHDHGLGWVIYAVQQGEMEMTSYARVEEPNGSARLVKRDTYRLGAGQCRVYLPGDIHDTRCISDSVLMLRFTSCDLKEEDSAGRMTRYAPPALVRASGS